MSKLHSDPEVRRVAGKAAALLEGIRVSDLMSTMVLANVFPLEDLHEVLAQTGKTRSVAEKSDNFSVI